ncbi:MAG: hypothetical protein JWM11_4412 [Planctomycetaceae bacterium]|nr:hypothetical protein [Planctomycetaceae bacterium]
MKPNRRIVQEHNGGGWEVKAPRADRASSTHSTQGEAIDRARQILTNTGGGELTIKGRDGKIRDSDTVSPGNDPNPPRDRK